MNLLETAIALAKAEEEEKVILILSDLGYWQNLKFWKPFGDNENNFSIIGNQQSRPDAALVEKIINSVDAILMKECLAHGIPLDSSEAPQSIEEALKIFFDINKGKISEISSGKRTQMAQNIILAATGKIRGEMNLSIIDHGEGQTPYSMPNTILSITRSNKQRVHFVQGKYNMGGTGVLQFCGDHRLQLVISKRCPTITSGENPLDDKWSFTIVRRENVREDRRSSMYTYLADENGQVLNFDAAALPIVPITTPRGSYEDFPYGTLFKLYNYSLTPSKYKSNILFDFNYRLSMLLPNLAHPIRLRECRMGYSGNTLETTLSGLEIRLADDRQDNIEEGFPDSHQFNIDGQTFFCAIYLFRKDKASNYRERDGIIYTFNGQTHGCTPDSFFNRANLSYLANDLLILVDCSYIDTQHFEDLFMTSRDRLRSIDFSKVIENRILEILKNHDGLRRIQTARRAELLQDKIGDNKPLKTILENIIKKIPGLSRILLEGEKLSSPFDLRDNAGSGVIFIGKKHPTYFERTRKGIAKKPINHDFRIQFETDAENNYFSRQDDPGRLFIDVNGVRSDNLIHHLGLFNGIATLTINMPDDAAVGKIYIIDVNIDDDCVSYAQSLTNTITLEVDAEDDNTSSKARGNRTPPSKNDENGKRIMPRNLGIPEIAEVYQADWSKYNMTEESAMVVMLTEESRDYYINMDNLYFLFELKNVRDVGRIDVLKVQYKTSMALIGMATISYYRKLKESEANVTDEVDKVTSILSPILLPLLNSVGSLSIDSESNSETD